MKLTKSLGIGAGIVGILGLVGYKLGLFTKPETITKTSAPTEPDKSSEPTRVEDLTEPSVPGGVSGMQIPAQDGGVANLPATSDMTTSDGSVSVPTAPAVITKPRPSLLGSSQTAPSVATAPTGHKAPSAPKVAPINPMTDPKGAAAQRAAGLAASMPGSTPSGAAAGMAQGLASAAAQSAAAQAVSTAAKIAAAEQAARLAQATADALKGITPPPTTKPFSLLRGRTPR